MKTLLFIITFLLGVSCNAQQSSDEWFKFNFLYWYNDETNKFELISNFNDINTISLSKDINGTILIITLNGNSFEYYVKDYGVKTTDNKEYFEIFAESMLSIKKEYVFVKIFNNATYIKTSTNEVFALSRYPQRI